ncbi:SMI1/KNR4 family protein [Aquimarina rhabdastrellae]
MSDLNQIKRIKLKLDKVKISDPDFNEFGARSHKYQLNKPVTTEQLLKFENTYNIILPSGYRSFITKIGNGGIEHPNYINSKSGAGPGYGIFELGIGINYINDYSSIKLKEEPYFSSKITDDEWYENYESLDDNITDDEFELKYGEMLSGIMIIGHRGCSQYQGLIINGKDRGKVIYLYNEMEYKPHIAEEGLFLDWYEKWLDGILKKAVNNKTKRK